jgi:NAD(P)-dependent dehydrogenase (short-subunit alcohol dehydrogenase family)
MFDLNVKSIFFLIKEAKPLLMKAKNDPNILIITSLVTKRPTYTSGVYAMGKAALDNMA